MTLKRIARGFLIVAGAFVAFVMLLFLILVGAAAYYATPSHRPDIPQSSLQATSTQPHRIELLDSGAGSLQRRLELIRSARESLELEFFIYNVDEASRLVTQALMAQAAKGVKVRLLVDFSAPVFQLEPVYARFLKGYGISVRYYNTAALYRLFSVQHRSHRKLLIVDGRGVLTGGRNIADDYFDLSPHYNFLDSDLHIEGPIAHAVRSSFELYWDSPLARAPKDLDRPLDPGEMAHARAAFLPRPGDEELASAAAAASVRPATFACRDISFATDLPDKGEGNRRVFEMISGIGDGARSDVWVETPYFVIKDGGYALLQRMRQNGARIHVLTNSLHSTDAFYTVAALYSGLEWIARSGLELRAYNGAPPAGLPEGAPGRSARWGIHSKRAVIDDRTVIVGTYNIDPRSANLNSELIVVCRDQPELAAAVLASIRARAAQSAVVLRDGLVVDEEALFGASSVGQRTLFLVSIPFARLFDFLL